MVNKYFRAEALFRARETVAREELEAKRQFHAEDSLSKSELAVEQQRIDDEALRIDKELHSLGFSVRVKKSRDQDEYQLCEGSKMISSFFIPWV